MEQTSSQSGVFSFFTSEMERFLVDQLPPSPEAYGILGLLWNELSPNIVHSSIAGM